MNEDQGNKIVNTVLASFDVIRERNQELEKKIHNLEYRQMSEGIPGDTILNMINIASSFSVLENASMTTRILNYASDFIRYYTQQETDMTTIGKEFSQLSNYLAVISEQFDRKLEYRISCRDGLEDIRIPILSLLPFVQLMTGCCIREGIERARIYIDAAKKEDRAMVTMQLQSDDRKQADLTAYRDEILNGRTSPENLSRRFEYCGYENCDIKVESGLVSITFPIPEKER